MTFHEEEQFLRGYDWKRQRRAGADARGTIGLLLGDGLVLTTREVKMVFSAFGLYPKTATNDFLMLVDFRNDHLQKRIGVRVARSHYCSPRFFETPTNILNSM